MNFELVFGNFKVSDTFFNSNSIKMEVFEVFPNLKRVLGHVRASAFESHVRGNFGGDRRPPAKKSHSPPPSPGSGRGSRTAHFQVCGEN